MKKNGTILERCADLLDPRITDWEKWMRTHHIKLKPAEKKDETKKAEGD